MTSLPSTPLPPVTPPHHIYYFISPPSHLYIRMKITQYRLNVWQFWFIQDRLCRSDRSEINVVSPLCSLARPLLRTCVFVYTLAIDIKVMTSKFRIIMTLSTFSYFYLNAFDYLRVSRILLIICLESHDRMTSVAKVK